MSLDDIEDAYPLTPTQQGMLYHVLQGRTIDAYVSSISAQIEGPLDACRFHRAWQAVVARHEALRTAFVWDGLAEPLQLVRPAVPLPWEARDWRGLSHEAQERALGACMAAQRAQPFALDTAPLMRLVLIRCGDARWQIVWTIHHLLADGWSTPLILADLVRAYDVPAQSLPPPTLRYADFVAWSTSRERADALGYWQQHLAGSHATPLRLAGSIRPGGEPGDSVYSADFDDASEPAQCPGPTGRAPGTEFAGPSHRERLAAFVPTRRSVFDEADTTRLQSFCREHRLTLGTLVHAAWALTLHAHCGGRSVLFGTTGSGRSVAMPGIDEVVGLCLNTLPLRVEVPLRVALVDWLRGLQATLQTHAGADAVPLARLLPLIEREPGQEAFESIVVIEGHSADETFASADGEVVLSGVRYHTHSHYPLALLALPGRRLELALVHDKAAFTDRQAQALLEAAQRALSAMPANAANAPDSLHDRIVDSRALLALGTGAAPPAGRHRRMHRWFEQVCDANPDAPAVVDAYESLSYRQLDERANRIARALHQAAGGLPAVIGLMVPRCADQVAAMLAILKVGAAYLPLDPAYPQARLAAMMQATRLQVVLTQAALADRVDPGRAVVVLIESARDLPGDRLEADALDSAALAYVIFTSGSTGSSKGVRITHANLIYSTQARIEFYRERPERFLLLSSIAFDSSVVGLYWTLCTGSCLVLPALDQEKDAMAVSGLMARHRISHTLALPSLYHLLLRHGRQDDYRSLRCVIVAGEACTPALVREHFSRLPEAALFNEYGPTEATVWASVYEARAHDRTESVPIGRPIGNSRLMILNASRQLCPHGAIGELAIAGCGVSPGYLDGDAAHADRFVRDPFDDTPGASMYCTGDLAHWQADGNLAFDGRNDRQIKVRGYRIDPAEIEVVLEAHAGVAEAIVIARPITPVADVDAGVDLTAAAVDGLLARLAALPPDRADALLGQATAVGDEATGVRASGSRGGVRR